MTEKYGISKRQAYQFLVPDKIWVKDINQPILK
jgi:hypothetical protein